MQVLGCQLSRPSLVAIQWIDKVFERKVLWGGDWPEIERIRPISSALSFASDAVLVLYICFSALPINANSTCFVSWSTCTCKIWASTVTSYTLHLILDCTQVSDFEFLVRICLCVYIWESFVDWRWQMNSCMWPELSCLMMWKQYDQFSRKKTST